ncbi:unnamed protein product [Rhizophagus irregularis]|nr:unnamed protein product [Rhizophagus irregularis]
MPIPVDPTATKKIAFLFIILLPLVSFAGRRVSAISRPVQNLPETSQTLSKYEDRPGQMETFLAYTNNNFSWPPSMPEYMRRYCFHQITGTGSNIDVQSGRDIIFFYNALERREFLGHENDWVTVYNQEIKAYGKEYSDDELNHIFKEMPGAIQLPVNQKSLPRRFKTLIISLVHIKETSDQATSHIEVVSTTPGNPENLDDLISKKLSSGQIQHPICEKCSEEISIEFSKDTVFLSCNHAVHLDCINDLRKRCPTCESTKKSSSKKVKKAGEKKVSGTLKKLIKELSSETSQDSEVMEEGTGDFFDLYNTIINMEGEEEIAKRNVIKSYYNFGKALEDRYDHYKKNNPKRTAQALVNKEVRNQLSDSVSDDLLQKKKEWALKIYDLFSEIGEHMIQRIKSFSVASISKLSQDDIDHILVRFAK